MKLLEIVPKTKPVSYNSYYLVNNFNNSCLVLSSCLVQFALLYYKKEKKNIAYLAMEARVIKFERFHSLAAERAVTHIHPTRLAPLTDDAFLLSNLFLYQV